MAELENLSSAVYGVWPDLRLAYMSSGWYRFAEENAGEEVLSGEWPLGRSILEGMSSVVRRFYEINLRGCLTSGEPWSHEYECSSASTYRQFRQTAYPLGEGEGLLIANAIAVERPHDETREPSPPDPLAYAGDSGLITQCAHCRLVQNPSEDGRWDWIPEWVSNCPPRVSHGLCPVCFGVYYPLPQTEG